MLVLKTVNLIACEDSYHTIDTSACGFFESPSGKYIWEETDTYKDTIPNASGCDSILTINLEVKEMPNPKFSVDHYADCTPLKTTFYNNTNNQNQYAFDWDFGFGITTSQVSEISIVYEDPGHYGASLSATSNEGCTATITKEDLIFAMPYPEVIIEANIDDCSKKGNLNKHLDSTY